MNLRKWGLSCNPVILAIAAALFATSTPAQLGHQIFVENDRRAATEQAAYKAFRDETFVDKKIELGEAFEKNYANSVYSGAVDDSLTFLYYNRGNWPKFYATADRTIAEDPTDLPVLRLAGWVIARDYDPSDPGAAASLNKAEKYEKRALARIAATKKPKEQSDAEFEQQRASQAWQAHSALGMIYFRRNDYQNSAKEFQTAAEEESPRPDPTDLYILAVDLESLRKTSDAVEIFTQCAKISGDVQDRCQYGAANPAEETDFVMFRDEPISARKIKLGEDFDREYPAGRYEGTVDSTLVTLYELNQDWDKFYATTDRVLAKDPDNLPVLAFAGWVIPRVVDVDQPDAAAKLDISEKYEKRAIELIDALQPSVQLNGDDFNQMKAQAEWQAHSGLGLTYFRRHDYQDSARELESALQDSSGVDPFYLYVLGTDLRLLNRNVEAAQAFTKCGGIDGSMRAQCKRDAAMAMTVAGIKTLPAEPGPKPGTVSPSPAQGDSAAAGAPAPANVSVGNSMQSASTGNAAAPPEKTDESTSAAPANGTTLTAENLSFPSMNAPMPAPADIPPVTTPGSMPTIKAQTVSVPVRVVVRDKNGHAVANLKKEDFKLFQDGKPQTILNFNSIADSASSAPAPTRTAPATSATAASLGAVSPTASPAAPASRFIVLFIDDVHLYFSDGARVRSAAEKYVNTLSPEDRVAIVTASGENQADFTNDRDKLRAALNKFVAHQLPGGPGSTAGLFPCPPAMTFTEAEAIVNGGSISNTVLGTATGDVKQCMQVHSDVDLSGLASDLAEQVHNAAQLALDSVFDSLRATVRRLAVLPGQRTVVLVSPGFIYSHRESDFAEITNLAIRSNVVLNTLDAKGVYAGEGKWDPDRFKNVGYGHAMEDAVLEDLASSTGGLFIHFNNDLAGAMREMSEPPEAYYLLAYAPQDLAADGKFHTLKVSLAKRSSGTVQARKGFYAPSQTETPEQAATREIEDAVFSQDDLHDLAVKMETSLAAAEANAGARKLSVVADLDVSQMPFAKINGANEEVVTVVASLFDTNGNYVAGTKKVVEMRYDDASLQKLGQTGTKVDFDFDLKAGDYFVRLVALDGNDAHMATKNASVTVPN